METKSIARLVYHIIVLLIIILVIITGETRWLAFIVGWTVFELITYIRNR